MKKILVAVTGMSPQIVTETVYALYNQHAWIPDEVFVLTTQTGRQKLENSLLGENGFFRRLQQDYDLPHIDFDLSHIRVIQDSDGVDLADIRTPEQNNLAADMIVRFIHDLCADDDTELHVSIAGGRKSMGFYIGYALSLFGRRQDKLSHVLVEAAFENNREFFYPPKKTLLLNADVGIKDASQAEVMLAEIPFVRMREGMPKLKLGDEWNFSQAVALTQADLNQNQIRLYPHIKKSKRRLVCNQTEIELETKPFALYWALVLYHQQGIETIEADDERFYDVFLNCWQKISNKEIHYEYENRKLAGDKTRPRTDMEKLEKRKQDFADCKNKITESLRKKLGDYASNFDIVNVGGHQNPRYCLRIPVSRVYLDEAHIHQ